MERSNALYNHLSLISPQERKHFYASLTGEEKTFVWKSQIREFEAREVLNEEQRQVLAAANDLLDRGVVEFDRSTAEWLAIEPELEQLEQRARLAFSREAAASIFVNLGRHNPSEITISLNKTRAISANDPIIVDCECSLVSDWCFGGNCAYPQRACKQYVGCGWWLQYACDGMCQ